MVRMKNPDRLVEEIIYWLANTPRESRKRWRREAGEPLVTIGEK
jgi:hypothetical protein